MAFTVLELLVVMAIISALIAMILPSLSAGRERAKVDVCLSNLRQIGTGLTAYQQDSAPYAIPWYVAWSSNGKQRVSSGGAFGGFYTGSRTPDGPVPTELRPLNRYVGLPRQMSGPIATFQCPSDDASYTWFIGTPAQRTFYRSAWLQTGNSYTTNWHWMEPLIDSGSLLFSTIDREGPGVLRRNVGGKSSEFIIIMENCADAAFAGATNDLATSTAEPVVGWHGRRNWYSVLFLDGHAAYNQFDARLSSGPGWSIW